MPNPWDRQPRQTIWLPEGTTITCPACGHQTDSLKQYRFISWVLFYLVGAVWQAAYYRGCPSCVRGQIGRRMAWSVIPANLLWFLLILPWGLWLIVASYRKGHSLDVLRQISPEQAAAREAAQFAAAHEVSWGRVWVIIGLLVCWIPVIGLPFVLLAYLTNRKATDWKRLTGMILLMVNVMASVALAVLIAVNP
jgi:hypothetical protein